MKIEERLKYSTYGIAKATKQEVIDYFGRLPSIKEKMLIVRQKGHPLGNWEVFKPTRKHQFFIRVFS